jgi:sugar lactone lactonase YvrE
MLQRNGERIENASSMAMDKAGNLYVSNTLQGIISRVTPSGVVSVYAGSAHLPNTSVPPYVDGDKATATLANPGAITFDPAGNLLVIDSVKIRKIAADGSISTLPGTNVRYDPQNADRGFSATDMVFDPVGNLYVADSGYGMVRRIAPDGTITNVAGHCTPTMYVPEGGLPPIVVCGRRQPVDGVGSAASLEQPRHIGIDSKGNMVLVDWFYLRHVVPDTGQVSMFAGYGGPTNVRGNVDGAPTTARFSMPTGIAADENGNIYVADSSNNAIRKVAADGTVSTVFTMGQPRNSIIEDYGPGAPRRLLYLGNKTFYVLTDTTIMKVILP